MAANFARTLGTEKDRVNCPFYFRIGACRHGDRCSRTHLKPHFSQTIMIPHMYVPSSAVPPTPTNEQAAEAAMQTPLPDEEEFSNFYEDVLDECEAYGRVEDMLVLQNMGEHMTGNTYIKFRTEEEAEDALKGIKDRFYWGRQLHPEFSPVTDFHEAVCGMFKKGYCERGDFCNFMHARPLSKDLRRRLKDAGKRQRRARSRSRSPASRSRSRSISPVRDTGRSPSEERRARIAAWNAEKAAGNQA